MSLNGQIPQSELAPIAGGYLRKDAAAAFNAMNVEIRAKYGFEVRPGGDNSSYRPLATQQYFWDLYQRGLGNLAAYPGTSNHGWGLAVDEPIYSHQAAINDVGPKYGWAKKWSDAQSEPWHFAWSEENCQWSGKDPGPGGAGADPYPVLKKGDRGSAVKRAQKHLRRWNLGIERPEEDGDFGEGTFKAVKQFQVAQGLHPDGVIGKTTWKRLRQRRTLGDQEQAHVNVLRWYRRSRASRKKNKGKIDYHRLWIMNRIGGYDADAKKLPKAKRPAYWDKNNRRERRAILVRSVSGKKD